MDTSMDTDDMIMEYTTTLEDLTFNSKPHINALTILADENKKDASKVVNAILHRLHTAPPDQKLYPLYLVDSIIKNLRESPYLSLFTQAIVPLFTHVFEKVDEKTRLCMYKLRHTWLDLFPNSTLLSLDHATKAIDPRWPITATLENDDDAVGGKDVGGVEDADGKVKGVLNGGGEAGEVRGVSKTVNTVEGKGKGKSLLKKNTNSKSSHENTVRIAGKTSCNVPITTQTSSQPSAHPLKQPQQQQVSPRVHLNPAFLKQVVNMLRFFHL